MSRLAYLLATSAALSACGGGSSSSPEETSSIESYKSLTEAKIEHVVLMPATAEELETQLKNGIRLGVYIDTPEFKDFARVNAPTVVAAEAEAAFLNDAQSSEFSQTNTHFQGVDEADFVKYDGQYLYAVTHPEYIWNQDAPEAAIRIMETDPANANITEISRISIDNSDWGEISELYLAGTADNTESLVTLRSSWNYFIATEPFLDQALFVDFWWPTNFDNKILLNAYDVSAPSAPTPNFSLQIDGTLHDSRKVDNTLYLVTQFSPNLPEIGYYFTSVADAEENEENIQSLSLDELLPQVRVNGGEPQALFAAEDCLIPVNSSTITGYQHVISLIAIDLDTQEITATRCLNTQVQGIYATQNNVYIGASSDEVWTSFESFTVMHKFALDDALSYRSTGVVKGSLGWRDTPFRMHEYNDLLHVVTTTRNELWQPEHHLSVLSDSETTDEMELVAQIPNDNRPETIGKPNEDIFAVRFLEDKAFVVTFERIDPLYVIDLSDHTDPQIAGELEVPGFSTYLHPVGDNYLLGIGQDSGIKVSLFDVSDMENPSLLDSHTLGTNGSYSAAEYDLRAITFLQDSADQLRFTLPSSMSDQWVWQEESLQLFELNGLADSSASLNRVGSITSETRSDTQRWPSHSGIDRSVLHEDAVYYIHGGEVWASFWSSPENAVGPQ